MAPSRHLSKTELLGRSGVLFSFYCPVNADLQFFFRECSSARCMLPVGSRGGLEDTSYSNDPAVLSILSHQGSFSSPQHSTFYQSNSPYHSFASSCQNLNSILSLFPLFFSFPTPHPLLLSLSLYFCLFFYVYHYFLHSKSLRDYISELAIDRAFILGSLESLVIT